MDKWEPSEQVPLESILHDITNNEVSFRIAAEPPKPQYVPFKNMEEFIPHYDKWIKPKDFLRLYRPLCVIETGIKLSSGEFYAWCLMFENFTFADGTPCGKLKE